MQNNKNIHPKRKLFTKDFTLVVIGQIISLFGSGILTFALPLYLLQETGSSAIFGTATALAFIPMIILTPIGGVIADRTNKRNAMIILDISTAVLMLALCLLLEIAPLVPLIIVVMMVLFGIEGIYSPTVQSAVPFLVDEKNRISGNAIISQISALSNLVAPLIGGFLFPLFGIMPIVIASGICFFLSAVLELFISIPYTKQERTVGAFATIAEDLKISFNYMKNEQPIIIEVTILFCLLNLFISSLTMISLPVLIYQHLGLSEELYGLSMSILGIGGLVGGVLVGVFGSKLKLKAVHRFFWLLSLSLMPMSATLYFTPAPMVSYIIITASVFFIMVFSTIITIQTMTYLQNTTPPHLLGKVISLAMTFAMFSMPIGQALYGILFEYLAEYQYAIILATAIITVPIAIFAKYTFRKID